MKETPTKTKDKSDENDQDTTCSSKKLRKFDLSSVKQNSNYSNGTPKSSMDNFKKFELIMTCSFGLNSSSDIYPRYEPTGIEKSIAITDRFFGTKPRYFNIMNRSVKKQQQAQDILTVKYRVDTFEFNTHIDMTELGTNINDHFFNYLISGLDHFHTG